MVSIEVPGLFILGIDNKRVHGDFGPAGALHGVPQQRGPEFATAIVKGNGKAAKARHGNDRIAWHAFGKPGRHSREEHPACGQGIEAGDAIGRDFARHEAGCGAAAHILSRLLPKVAIERIHPALKPRTIMARPERLYDEGSRHREDAIKRECAFLARFMAGARTGGLRSNETKRC